MAQDQRVPRRRSAVDADLAALYGQVPSLECKGLCQSSCGPIEMSGRERQRLRQRGVTIPPRRQALQQLAEGSPGVPGGHDGSGTGAGTGGGYTCPALGADGGCRVHDVRPMVCRIWGTTASLACPFGCAPDGGSLDDADALDLLAASLQVGGAPAEFEGVRPGVGQVLRTDSRLRRAVSGYVRHHQPRP